MKNFISKGLEAMKTAAKNSARNANDVLMRQASGMNEALGVKVPKRANFNAF